MSDDGAARLASASAGRLLYAGETMALRFELNGEPIEVDGADPAQSFLHWLRASGRTGTKEGCAEGECGSCAVALLARDAEGRAAYRAVNSCLLPLGCVAGQRVVSVEGVGRARSALEAPALHPVQAALCAGGSQCGYCTPGFVASMFAEYYRPLRTDFDLEALDGNLCRCTGYRPILEAARALPPPAGDDPRCALLREPPPPLAEVSYTPAGGRFFRPTSLAALFSLRTAHPEAVLIAGGTDLMVPANQQGKRLPVLIALEAIPELTTFRRSARSLTLGAALPLSELAVRLMPERASIPALTSLFPRFASRLIRNRATLGGNLQTASPIGDAAPALLALEASLSLLGPAGERLVALDGFFRGYRRTALAADEVIGAIHVPLPAPRWSRFYKVAKRAVDDISTVAAAFALDLHPDGTVARLRIAYGGVAATPLRAATVEERAIGRPWTQATLGMLIEALAEVGTPLDDHRGSAAYRRALMGRLLEKFWLETRREGRTP